jgi:hypothetical protein
VLFEEFILEALHVKEKQKKKTKRRRKKVELIVREYSACFLIVLMFSYLFCLHCHRVVTQLQLVIIIMQYKGTEYLEVLKVPRD